MIRGLRTWTRTVLVVVPALLLATACNATFDVAIEVDEGGAGIVRTELVIDQETTAALLDLEQGLPLTDLAEAGWDPVVDRTPTADGGTRITAEKPFGTPDEFAEVMRELTGNRILSDFVLIRSQSFGQVDYQVRGTIDTTDGLAAFGDPTLESNLGRSLLSVITGPPYNASPEDVAIDVTVRLPGEALEEGSTGEVTGGELQTFGTWSVLVADRDEEMVAIASSRRSTSAQVLRGVAVVAGALAALVAFAQLLRVVSGLSRNRSRPRPKPRPTDARGRPTGESTMEQPVVQIPEDPVESFEGYKVVALDGMGVLYREGDDVRRLLIPFARDRGSMVPDEDIAARARLLSLGRMTPADFWAAIGVVGDPNELDAAYLATHQLMPGVVKYLRSLRDSGIRAACITNDAPAWATKLRGSHSLEGLVDPWVVSGSVGVRKPDRPLFEVLRRVTGEPPGSILVIDDDLDNLDAARDMGFGTAWFSADGERADARGHDLFRSFDAADAAVETSGSILEEATAEDRPASG
ncbi:MAG: HAD-IA family hydrolase [Actinomycetota bacterium]